MALLLACAPHPATPAPTPVSADAANQPRLPAPVANVYTHVRATPGDALVAAAMAGAPWDEALAGAAAGVALDLAEDVPVDMYGLRWRAVLAAYPFPIVERATATAEIGKIPTELAAQARARAQAGADVGLVRARNGDKDLWVLLVGDRRGEVPRVAREYQVGDSVTLGEGAFAVSDPLGQVRPAAKVMSLDMQGEWLLQARDERGTLATMPVYVGMATPKEPPIQDDARGATPEDQARDLLGAVWSWYGRPTPTWDDTLNLVARVRLKALAAGETPEAVERQLRAAGFVGVPVAGAECRAASVAACLDGMWWSPERRAVLVGGFPEMGVAVGAQDGQVTIVLVGAG